MEEKINKKLEEWCKKLEEPIDTDGLKIFIYNTFALTILMMPIVPEYIGIGLYSLKNTIFNFITILTTILLLIISIKQKTFKLNIFDKLIIVYLALVIISCILSEFGFSNCILGSNGRGEGLITLFSYMATFIIFAKGYKYLKHSMKFTMVASIVVAIYGIIQAIVPNTYVSIFLPKRAEGIAMGTMKNQNFLSSYLCINLPIYLIYYLNNKEKKFLIGFIVLFIALVLTKTLGGYMTILIMTILIYLYLLIVSENKKKLLISLLVILIGSMLIFGILGKINNVDYFKELFGIKDEIENLMDGNIKFATNRLAIWEKVTKVICNNPLFGVGPDSLKEEFKANKETYLFHDKKDILNRRIIDKSHCEWLHIAATTGIPSLIIVAIIEIYVMVNLLKLIIKKSKKIKHEDNLEKKNRIFTIAIFASCLGYLMQSMASISVVQVAPIFWAILGLGMGIVIEEKKINEIPLLLNGNNN